jgi:hypothetical protein
MDGCCCCGLRVFSLTCTVAENLLAASCLCYFLLVFSRLLLVSRAVERYLVDRQSMRLAVAVVTLKIFSPWRLDSNNYLQTDCLIYL